VLTHNVLIPQVCNRKYVYQFNYNAAPTKLEFAEKYGADVVIWDERLWEPGTATLTETLDAFLEAGYRVTFESDGFFILDRTPSGGRGYNPILDGEANSSWGRALETKSA
jgi:hypothetical protein